MQNKKIISIFQTSFIYVFVFLVVGGFMSWFLYQQIRSEEAGLELAKNNYDDTLKQLDSFDSVKSDFEASSGLKDQVSGMIVNPGDTLGLIEELENAARVTGVTLTTNIGANPVTKNNPKVAQTKGDASSNTNASQEVWLELDVEGNYVNTLQFIRYLENAKKLINVSTISINQRETNATLDEFFSNPEAELGNLKTKILISNVF
jgi:hypothetical protein